MYLTMPNVIRVQKHVIFIFFPSFTSRFEIEIRVDFLVRFHAAVGSVCYFLFQLFIYFTRSVSTRKFSPSSTFGKWQVCSICVLFFRSWFSHAYQANDSDDCDADAGDDDISYTFCSLCFFTIWFPRSIFNRIFPTSNTQHFDAPTFMSVLFFGFRFRRHLKC